MKKKAFRILKQFSWVFVRGQLKCICNLSQFLKTASLYNTLLMYLAFSRVTLCLHIIFVSSQYFPKKTWIVASFWFWRTISCSRYVDFERTSECLSLPLDLEYSRNFSAVCSASRLDLISGALSSSSSSSTHGAFTQISPSIHFVFICKQDFFPHFCSPFWIRLVNDSRANVKFVFVMNKFFSGTRCTDWINQKIASLTALRLLKGPGQLLPDTSQYAWKHSMIVSLEISSHTWCKSN